jgi:hypothetical protein
LKPRRPASPRPKHRETRAPPANASAVDRSVENCYGILKAQGLGSSPSNRNEVCWKAADRASNRFTSEEVSNFLPRAK